MSTEYQDRQQRLQQLRAEGIDPYPSETHRTHSIARVIADFETEPSQPRTIVGRVRSIRRHGGSTFLDLADASSRMQCYLKEDIMGSSYTALLKVLDESDFLEVCGTPTLTKRGEKTLLAKTARVITKSLRPLPSQWYGLKDTEERFRKRYLDLLMNPEVTERMIARSNIIRTIRSIFDQKGFIEVSTPTLQPIYGGGFARPFVTHHNALNQQMYLSISDEMYLKRLIVGGFERVYEIYKVFRNEGIDRDHNPEFTMLEAQISYFSLAQAMDLIEEIFETVAQTVFGSTTLEYQGTTLSYRRPWKRLTMVESIRDRLGINPADWSTVDQAKMAARIFASDDRTTTELQSLQSIGSIVAFVFEQAVEETLLEPTIITEYPVEVSPLAKTLPNDPRFTQRFEYFVMGSELGNNYVEINDPADLNQRFIEEAKRKHAGFDEAHQTDMDYLEAIEHGFPPTTGIAIGIDRMVMMMTNAATIKEVIAFPTLKNKTDAV